MSGSNLRDMSVVQVVDHFAATAARQGDALLGGDIAQVNRLFDQLEAIEGELKSRPGDQRTALTALYDSPNLHVRLKAAKATLAVAPTSARAQLEQIEASGVQPQAGEAGMSLWNLDRGVFKPT
jgi:hypothetical protein